MNKKFPKPFIALLVIGLMMTTTFPLIARQFHWTDALTGFMMGTGIGLELLAVIYIVRFKKAGAR